MDKLGLYGMQFISYIGYTAIVLAFMYLIKLIDDWRTKKLDEDHEICENSNLAVAVRKGGMYLGVAIGMSGALFGASHGFVADAITLGKDGLFLVVALLLCFFICDKLMFRGVNNDTEVGSGNTALALAEFGSYVATGLIINGAFSGYVSDLDAYITAAVYFVLGQVALLIMFYAYEAVTSFNVKDEIIKKKNTSAGVAVAGVLIALGLILRTSVLGSTSDWGTDIPIFAIVAIEGIVLFLVFKFVVDLLFLPKTTIKIEVERDQNTAAMVLTESIVVALAFVIASTI